MEATAPYTIIYYLECSCIGCLCSTRALMFQHLDSEACQCSSITSALCSLLIPSYVIALTSAHTRMQAAYASYSVSISLCFSVALYLSLVVSLTHTHTFQIWGQDVLALPVFDTRFNVVSLWLHKLWMLQPDSTDLFVFSLSFLR